MPGPSPSCDAQMVSAAASSLARRAQQAALPDRPTRVGGVTLPHPIIVAAGLVKGDGFPDESAALAAVAATARHRARLASAAGARRRGRVRVVHVPSADGNSGRTMWRIRCRPFDAEPGGTAKPGRAGGGRPPPRACPDLPPTWGVSVATSPGVTDLETSHREVEAAATIFLDALRRAAVAALPGSRSTFRAPTPRIDPTGTQSAELAEAVCSALAALLPIPLWVKIGPDLSDAQLSALTEVFAATGVTGRRRHQHVVAARARDSPQRGGQRRPPAATRARHRHATRGRWSSRDAG